MTRLGYTRSELARLFGVRRSTISDAIHDGSIRTIDVRGSERIPQIEVDRIQREGLPKPRARPMRGAQRDIAAEIRAIDVASLTSKSAPSE